VDPQLFERALEQLGVELQPLRQVFGRTRLGRERLGDRVQHLDVGIVAAVEELVRPPVGVGVEQDRSRRQAVA